MTIEELAAKLGIDLDDAAKEAIESYMASQTVGLKRTNKELKEEKRSIAEKLAKFRDFDMDAVGDALGNDDFDLDELPALIKALKVETKDAPKDDPRVAELERKLERAEKRHQAAFAERDSQLNTITGALTNSTIDAQATQAISAAKGSVKGLMPHVKGRIKAEVDENGHVEMIILAPNGEPMEDASGTPATLKHLVDELRRDDELGALFEAAPGGSGAPRQGGTKHTGKTWKEMNLDERSELSRSNPALAATLKAAA